MKPLKSKRPRILLVISGSIAAQKCPDLVERLLKAGNAVACILTTQGGTFVSQKKLEELLPHAVFTDPWTPAKEKEIEHIRLARECDLILVAPASANMIAKMARGIADNLASTVLLASRQPVVIVPAMNTAMWEHEATQTNCAMLRARGVEFIGPTAGDLACGETGEGRMVEPAEITAAITARLHVTQSLKDCTVLVTSGPTHEPLDPVRFIGNRSSGKQGHAIANALARAGASVTLITGPVALPDPAGVKTIHVQTADDMLKASLKALPADIAVCAAAVADWKVKTPSKQKMKKGKTAPSLKLALNPDILAAIAKHKARPKLVIGFAAETQKMDAHVKKKFAAKGCDWIVANDVSDGQVFGKENNRVTIYKMAEKGKIVKAKEPDQSKQAVAQRLAVMIGEHLANHKGKKS